MSLLRLKKECPYCQHATGLRIDGLLNSEKVLRCPACKDRFTVGDIDFTELEMTMIGTAQTIKTNNLLDEQIRIQKNIYWFLILIFVILPIVSVAIAICSGAFS